MKKYIDRYYLNGEVYGIKFGGGGRLPSAYQEVEYIESSGTQYIDTNFNATGNTEFEFEFIPTSISGYQGYFGARKQFGQMQYNIYNDRFFSFGTQTQSSGSFFTADTRYNVSFKNLTVFKDEISQYTYSAETFATPSTLLIGAIHESNSITNYSSEKIISLKLRDNGTLVRNFVPCYRIADTVIGMYDLVNNQFYTNAGTGTFTKGPDVN